MSGVRTAVSRAARCLAAGIRHVAGYPTAWLLTYAASLVIALPIAVALARTLNHAADGFPAPLGRGALNVDWWQRLRQLDSAFASELLPRTLGFAAPLDSLSMLVGGLGSHSWPIVIAVMSYAALWAVLWAVMLTRIARRRDPGWRSSWLAARRLFAPMLAITLAAALVVVTLSLTVRPLLLQFDPWLPRAALVALFGALLLAVSVIADVSRAHCVLSGERSLARNLAAATRLVSGSIGTVLLIAWTWLTVHLVVLVGYGVAEVMGGARLGGWRAVVVAQGYVCARLLLRLLWGSSFLAWTQEQRHAAPR